MDNIAENFNNVVQSRQRKTPMTLEEFDLWLTENIPARERLPKRRGRDNE